MFNLKQKGRFFLLHHWQRQCFYSTVWIFFPISIICKQWNKALWSTSDQRCSFLLLLWCSRQDNPSTILRTSATVRILKMFTRYSKNSGGTSMDWNSQLNSCRTENKDWVRIVFYFQNYIKFYNYLLSFTFHVKHKGELKKHLYLEMNDFSPYKTKCLQQSYCVQF